MSFTFFVLLLIGPAVFLQTPASSRCACKASDESTRAGANENIVIAEREKRRYLEGVVSDVNGEPLSDVLVEVFNEPDYLLLSYPESAQKKKAQQRLAACVVRSDGKFCFRGLPPGKYELRFSKDGGWKHTQVYVIVAPLNQKAAKGKLQIAMQVGT